MVHLRGIWKRPFEDGAEASTAELVGEILAGALKVSVSECHELPLHSVPPCILRVMIRNFIHII